MLPLGRNKVLGRIKQGGELDLACWPCICHLWSRGNVIEENKALIYVPVGEREG